VQLKDNQESAYQLRRYAWNVGIPISILTDFEEFIVYDCRVKPNDKDNPNVARIMVINYKDYLENFDKIWDIFSKEAVLKGSFDKFITSEKGMKGTSEVDNEFLKEIEKWRDSLAKNLALRNPNLNISELNYSVQKIIDRILFLIICEYKNIEKYETLNEIAKKENIYKNLIPYFKEADDRYNSGIFDFSKDKLTSTLLIDDKILKEIIVNLYYPKSPYDFSVLPIEILGKVYEKFLGKTIRLTSSHQAKVEEKPEIRKAGGVYYTPEFVVNYIVKNTIGKLIEGKTPKQIENIKILDSACGSGTFLVRAYTYILNSLLEYYKQNPTKYKKEIYQDKKGNWRLTTDIRKNVLLNIKNKTGEQIKICTTDGFMAYDNIVKQNWGYDNQLGKYKVFHKIVTQRKGEGFNIWVERLHNTIRQRTQNFRGFHGSVESAYSLMKGIEIFYNFIKPHEALKGKSPSELAIPSLQFETPNRWLELIKLADKK